MIGEVWIAVWRTGRDSIATFANWYMAQGQNMKVVVGLLGFWLFIRYFLFLPYFRARKQGRPDRAIIGLLCLFTIASGGITWWIALAMSFKSTGELLYEPEETIRYDEQGKRSVT